MSKHKYRSLTQEFELLQFVKKSNRKKPKQELCAEVYIDERLTIPLILDAVEKLVKREEWYENIDVDIIDRIIGVTRRYGKRRTISDV